MSRTYVGKIYANVFPFSDIQNLLYYLNDRSVVFVTILNIYFQK
jgi:hypothetical protein